MKDEDKSIMSFSYSLGGGYKYEKKIIGIIYYMSVTRIALKLFSYANLCLGSKNIDISFTGNHKLKNYEF